jgi:hypothetical protein
MPLPSFKPDATLSILIPTFDAPWTPPSPTVSTLALTNCTPTQFGLTVQTQAGQGRITVVQPSGSGSSYVPGTVTVSSGAALQIAINVVSGSLTPPNVNYTECGLVFAPATAASADRHNGRDNFPGFVVGAGFGLVVLDAWSFGASYEFMVLIQNQQGGVGVVDPRITNDLTND